MEHPRLKLEDLPDEILIIIFQQLQNCDVHYSFMGLNKRFDSILNEGIFTRNFILTKSTHSLSFKFPDIVIDRYCFEILPKINNKIEQLYIQSSFMKRILLGTDYPNLHSLGVYDFSPEIDSQVFDDGSYLIHRFQNQISSLFIRFNSRERLNILEDRFKNLRYLNIGAFSIPLCLSFTYTNLKDFNSNLLELHVEVKCISDCLRLLAGELNQLRMLYINIRSPGFDHVEMINEHKKLSNLKCFSLIHEDSVNIYDVVLVPLIPRMTNLEELNLYFADSYGSMIDGDSLEKNIINHLTRLNKLTFNIRSITSLYFDEGINVPSSEDIKRTFENYPNNQIVSSIDYFSQRNEFYCHVYSCPYIWTSYYNITNNFAGGLFKSVREISLYDEHPFEHDFFSRIAESFPFVRKITSRNVEGQKNNHVQSSKIHFRHLTQIDLAIGHEDYVEEFLNHTKICLLNNVCLRVSYKSLRKVTNNFTRDVTRDNCSKIISLILIGYMYYTGTTFIGAELKDYFPHAKIH